MIIEIDISNCENKIRISYNISNEELLIFHDVFNLENDEYFKRIFTKEGKELNSTIYL